jgi:hypothetical protein
MIAAAALAPWLAGCTSGGDPDALSGGDASGGQPVYVLLVSRDHQPAPIVSSTTADYGSYGVSEPGTDWGGVNSFHTQCLGACRTLAGGG